MGRMTSAQRMELWAALKAADVKTKKEIFLMLGKDLMANGHGPELLPAPPKDE